MNPLESITTGVLTKISPQGEVLWTNTCHNRDVGLRPVGTDADGNVYLSSNFRSWNNGTGMIHIDATGTQHTVSNPGIGRAFLLQVDGNGIWQWGRSFGNLGSGPSAAIYVADMDVVDNDVRVVGSYFAGEVDFEGGDVVLPSSSHYRGYAAVYDLTGDLVQAADFDLSDELQCLRHGHGWWTVLARGKLRNRSNARKRGWPRCTVVQHRLVGFVPWGPKPTAGRQR